MSRADGHASPAAPAADRLPRRPWSRCTSWWPRTTNSTCGISSSCWSGRGHSVRLANNGREALCRWPEARRRRPFDLLLLDVHMPELDGFQVISTIREREQAAGGSSARHRLDGPLAQRRPRALPGGRNGRIPRQADPGRGSVRRHRPALVSRPGARQPGQTEPADGASLLDPLVLLAACGDDPDGLRGLCEDFSAYTPKRLADVDDALRNQDAPRLREAAHKLRSLLATFSTLAGELASQLEDHAALGHLDEARHLVKRIEDMASRLIGQVDGLSYERVRQQAEAANGPRPDRRRLMRRGTDASRRVNYASGAGAVATATLAGAGPVHADGSQVAGLRRSCPAARRSGDLQHRLMHIGIEWLVQGDHGDDAESAEDSHQLRLDHGNPPGQRALIPLLRGGVQGPLQVVQDRQQLQGELGRGARRSCGQVARVRFW